MNSLQNMIELNDRVNNFINRMSTMQSQVQLFQHNFNEFSDTISQFITRYENMLNNLPQSLNVNYIHYINNIYENISVIINDYSSDKPTNNKDIIKPIEDFTNYVEHDLLSSADDEIAIENKAIQTKIRSAELIDWKFLIPLIISLLSLFIQISDKIESDHMTKTNIEFQSNVINVLENIHNCLEQQNLKPQTSNDSQY